MKVLLPALLIAAATATAARAECTAPANEVKIPDGNTATMDEMLAAKHAIQENNAAVETYTQCLKAEQDAKIAAGGTDMKDEDRVKISTDYMNRQNAEVEKLQKLADKFNLEVRNYKAKHPAPAAATPPAPPK
jgi:crotonobetainyl-CoA:carnitine CoA-transferase CaiB-like acyl-CoA transferase